MPRIQIHGDLDAVFAIEDAIQRTLVDHPTARVSTLSVEKEYDLLDEKGEPVPSSLEDKCAFLANKFQVTFEIKEGDVWFRKSHRKPK